METKKNQKIDLERRRPAFFGIGLIVALSLTAVAFEWKQFDEGPKKLAGLDMTEIIEDEILVTVQEREKPKPPPPPPAPIAVKIVDNNIDIPDIDLDFPDIDEPVAIKDVDIVEPEPIEDEIFEVVEQSPSFVGGETELFRFLAQNIKYPRPALDAGIKGRVYVEFVVWKDGSIRDIKILRGIGGGCDEEVERVVAKMPNWNAGEQRGKKVPVRFRLPVNFEPH